MQAFAHPPHPSHLALYSWSMPKADSIGFELVNPDQVCTDSGAAFSCNAKAFIDSMCTFTPSTAGGLATCNPDIKTLQGCPNMGSACGVQLVEVKSFCTTSKSSSTAGQTCVAAECDCAETAWLLPSRSEFAIFGSFGNQTVGKYTPTRVCSPTCTHRFVLWCRAGLHVACYRPDLCTSA